MQAHLESLGGVQAVQGVQERSGAGAGAEALQPAVKHEKLDKRSGAVCQAYYAAASRIVCRRFQ